MTKISLNLQNSIAETLLITLYAKSVETHKKRPLIQDLIACDLVNKIDYDFSKFKNKRASSVGVAIRANHFDQQLKNFIQKHANPIIVIIGCGLDTRLQRIGELGQDAQFYQLDLPEVITLRQQLIPPQNNEHLIAASVLTTDWMDQLKQQYPNGNFMFIIEGVLMYFNEQENKKLFIALAERFPGAALHFDMLNKWMSHQSALHDTVSKTKAEFKFGLDNEKALEHWHPALKHMKSYLFNELQGYYRMGIILSGLMTVIPRFKTASRIMEYQIKNA
ncbi:class I SAM-dependent methyltransferase [Acinetobacter qingfengensis]|uniref:Methyltransferase n=1 Tax=Acinetobacter qingfengensis TaxID=1262585 RepID=A0A1E7QWE4_9GAMM|nr:class I SAM-dependent methyltransferase [Acinetobacter qingfengensis]KAA8731320.1 class I SAM-dependent methyltransferase [Acinetobacter qingfengensis]OEY91434.1 methyltransferase [Acinetobacter qingfengensis]